MRIRAFLLACCCFVPGAPAEDISRNPSVTIAGETLYLAYVETHSDLVVNEYIRKEETLENWKVLFGVRYVRDGSSVDLVVARWKSYLAHVNTPGYKEREKENSTAKDRRFMLAIRPPGDADLETDELRFIPAPKGGGVVYYQGAVRANPDNEADLMACLLKQVSLADALGSVHPPIFEQMPAHHAAAKEPTRLQGQ